MHESSKECSDWAAAQGGENPVATMDRLGMLTERLVAVHMTQLTPAELDRVAEAKVLGRRGRRRGVGARPGHRHRRAIPAAGRGRAWRVPVEHCGVRCILGRLSQWWV